MASRNRPASGRNLASASSRPASRANLSGDARAVNDRSSIPTTAGTKPVKMLGRFRLISILGEGAMGKVLRAEDTQLKRQVALKLLPVPKEPTYRVEQFVREGRSAAALEHPHIVQIYEVGQAGGHHYIAMELIEGGNLAALVRANGPLEVSRACSLGAEAAEALSYASQMGIVHRDVKPENLMLSRSGRCKLTDFGLASIDDPSDGFRMPNEAVGTPNYMSPEVVQNTPATTKSDVYSLGAVIFFLLTGRVPFPVKTREETMNAHVNTPPPDVRALRQDVPEGLAKLIWRAMAKDPARRPDAMSFALALRTYTIGSQGSQSGSISGFHPSASGTFSVLSNVSPPQSRWLFLSILIGLLAAAGLVTVLLMLVTFITPGSLAPAVVLRPAVPVPVAPAPVTPQKSVDKSALPLLPGEISATDFVGISKAAGMDKVVTVVGTVSAVQPNSDGSLSVKFRGSVLTARIGVAAIPAYEARFGPRAASLVKADVKIKSRIDYHGQPIIGDLTRDAITVFNPVP